MLIIISNASVSLIPKSIYVTKHNARMVFQWKDVLIAIINTSHIILDWILEIILGIYFGPKQTVSPPSSREKEDIVTKSAIELARLIGEGKLKSFDVVKAYYDRIMTVNRELNAVVDGPFCEALEEAKAIDIRLQNKEISKEELKQKPFLGVPFTTKDSIAVAGKLYTLGLISRKNERSTEDAECVRLTKAAGGIILANSNVPEVNKWVETRNMLIGTTKNPYDLRRSVGGSSGGEGALIAASCTAFGLGSDIGGSIRIPAFNCGIFGHKSSRNAVNTRGLTFRTGQEPHTMVVVGPMCKYACDLMPILKVITGPKMANKLRLNEKVNLKQLRYFYVPQNNVLQSNPISQETEAIMSNVRKHFSDQIGREVTLANLPYLSLTHRMWRYWISKEPDKFKNLLGNGIEINPIYELFKKILGQSEFTLAAIYFLIDSIIPEENEKFVHDASVKCKDALTELLGDDGVLFYHSAPRTAPFHYYPLVKFMDFSYTSIFNVLQVPVTQVPMGLDSKGMPLGIQVVSGDGNDRLCIAVAEELERAFGGWVPPYNTSY